MFRRFAVSVCLISGLTASAELADPTRPLVLPPGRIEGKQPVKLPRLSSVFIDDDRRRATIDGQLVAEGQRVNGAEVLCIHPDHVVVTLDDGRRIAVLRPDNNQIVDGIR